MRTLALLVSILVSGLTYGQDFHLVFLNKKDDKKELPEEEVKKLMDGHMANVGRLAKEGKLWAAGPFDGGGGIFVLKSASIDSVKRWILTDPAVMANRWDVEIFPYTPKMGGICAVGEKYEMTNYFFVRYRGPEQQKIKPFWSAHQKFIRPWTEKGSVIAEATLGESDVILVLKEDPTENLQEDPMVSKGGFQPTIKKLFIAKGSFCEPKQ